MAAFIWFWQWGHLFFTPLSAWDRLCVGLQYLVMLGVAYVAGFGIAAVFGKRRK
jgi:hypothetical protein